jgi:hypothetical protein
MVRQRVQSSLPRCSTSLPPQTGQAWGQVSALAFEPVSGLTGEIPVESMKHHTVLAVKGWFVSTGCTSAHESGTSSSVQRIASLRRDGTEDMAKMQGTDVTS